MNNCFYLKLVLLILALKFCWVSNSLATDQEEIDYCLESGEGGGNRLITCFKRTSQEEIDYCLESGEGGGNTRRSVKAFNKALTYERLIIDAEANSNNLTAEEYKRAADLYEKVIECASHSDYDAKCFAKIHHYTNKEISIILGTNKNPTEADYEYASTTYTIFAMNRLFPQLRAVNLSKAAEYKEKALEAARAGDKNPIETQYHQAAKIYIMLASCVPDTLVKAGHFAKAAEYKEKALEAARAGGKNPTSLQYQEIADSYCQAAEFSLDPQIKAWYCSKADEYCHLLTSLESENTSKYLDIKNRVDKMNSEIIEMFRDLQISTQGSREDINGG